MNRRGGLWVAAVIAFLSQLLIVAPVHAATNHIFDPLLSLTGGTTVSNLDPVPDPGETHPSAPFKILEGLAIDNFGDLYVASRGEENSSGEIVNGRIDVFDPSGHFLTEIHNDNQPGGLAVDANGVIYVSQQGFAPQPAVIRYTPSVYPPTSQVDYGSPSVVFAGNIQVGGLAVDPGDNHLFVLSGEDLNEYGSAGEGNPLIGEDIAESLRDPKGIAIDSSSGKIFVGSVCPTCKEIATSEEPHVSVVQVLKMNGELLEEVSGADLPQGGFLSSFGNTRPAVDEATGELFVADVFENHHVYRFVPKPGGGYEYVPDPEIETHSYVSPSRIVVANGPLPTEHNVYVTSSNVPGHLYAFTPEPEHSPPVVSATRDTGISTQEASLRAEVNPSGLATSAFFEYVSEETYLQDIAERGSGHGFDHAIKTSYEQLPAGNQPVVISAVLEGLAPGTTYHVRAAAFNHCNPSDPLATCMVAGEEVRFATYPEAPQSEGCPNEGTRSGLSRLLPDCRAFELVTPPDTNGRPPQGAGVAFGPGSFDTQLASPDGNSVLFSSIGGGLPGSDGSGIIDGYEARRSETGWVTGDAGFSGAQSQNPGAGGASPDHGYWFWSTGGGADHGSLVIGDQATHYLRFPDHTFRLLGEGPLGTDPRAEGRWISPNGSHVIFTSEKPLTEGASPEGVLTVYDRDPGGAVSVLSTKPDGEAPHAGADVAYLGAAADGSAAVFSVTEGATVSLYEKRIGQPTILVAEGDPVFAGLSADGARLTYLQNGDIFSFDASTGVAEKVGSGESSTVVNVSSDGLRIYFVSTKKLVSDLGPKSTKDNLYMWDASTQSIAFIAVLEHSDLTGASGVYGLGLWATVVGRRSADDPSRTTPDGRVFVFESAANLTGYDSGGHSEVYRFEAGSQPSLRCISCNPTLAAASGNAHLQVVPTSNSDFDQLAPLGQGTPVANVTDNGQMVFFQTPDPLVAQDVDHSDDVYEWEAQGVGGCSLAAGCLRLISSGHSAGPNYIFAATSSGSDVFFTTPDRLTQSDGDVTRSIYDARINGGFNETSASPCIGEACKAQSSPAPGGGLIASQVPPKHITRPCAHKRSRKARVRCHHKHRRHHRHRRRQQQSSKKGGAR